MSSQSGTVIGFRKDQIPRSLNKAPAESRRFPSPRSAARMAFTVFALGTLTSNGKLFSAATRMSNMRTASVSADTAS